MNKFLNLYNLILEELTDKQKELTDKYTAKRNKNLSFGPLFKEERTYFPIKSIKTSNIEIPDKIKNILDNAGFYITDYRAGLAMKKAKLGEQKDLRQIKIGKILQKLNQSNLLKQFNERLGTSKKNIQELEAEICITHNPYDIAGMSTDRNWTSCMELDKGEFKTTPLKQVQYGGMCAYLISTDDKNIEKPYARIAIKRFISNKDESKFIFLAEKTIYGDVDLAEEVGFQEELIKILEQSNKLTATSTGKYIRKDRGSYSDSYQKNYFYFDKDNESYKNWTKKQFLQKIVKASQDTTIKYPAYIIKYFIQKYPDIINESLYKNYISSAVNADFELLQILINQKVYDIPNIIINSKVLKFTDLLSIMDELIKNECLDAIFANYNIKKSNNAIEEFLNNYLDKLSIDDIILIFKMTSLSQEFLKKYIPIIIKQFPDIINHKLFWFYQDIPVDLIIKYCDKSMIKHILSYNINLNKNTINTLNSIYNK